MNSYLLVAHRHVVAAAVVAAPLVLLVAASNCVALLSGGVAGAVSYSFFGCCRDGYTFGTACSVFKHRE